MATHTRGYKLYVFFPAFLSIVLPIVHSACFTPNGTDRNEVYGVPDIYLPCDPSAEASMCCAIGPNRPSSTKDACVDGGLCFDSSNNWYWRESCTDPTWRDPACVRLFLNGTGFEGGEEVLFVNGYGNPEITHDVAVLACGDGKWCEGVDNLDCCENGDGIYVPNTDSINAQYDSFGLSNDYEDYDSPTNDDDTSLTLTGVYGVTAYASASSGYYDVTVTRTYPQLTQTAIDESATPGFDVVSVTETYTTSFFAESSEDASLSGNFWVATMSIPVATPSSTLMSGDEPAPSEDGARSSMRAPLTVFFGCGLIMVLTFMLAF